MKKIKFTAEDLPISECSFDTGRITMRFKNGKEYIFDKAIYLKCVRRQFDYISGGNISSSNIEKSIQDAIKARDAEEADAENGEKRKSVPERKIAFRLFENGEFQENADFADFSKFDEICENAMAIEGEPLEDFQYIVTAQLERLAFSQDFILLTRRDQSEWIKAKIPDKTYKYMYFYTNGKIENGYEIWHKAYDPVLWAGVAKQKQEKN